MVEASKTAEVKAAEAKQAAGETLTPGEAVTIAVDETNAAASAAVERGVAKTGSPPKEPDSGKP